MCFLAGQCQDLGAERHNEPGVFSDRNEVGGGQDGTIVFKDPSKRFETHDDAGGKVNDRLVVHHDAVLVQRGLECTLSDESVMAASSESCVIDFRAGSTQRLCLVHRRIRFAQQPLRGAAAVQGDSNSHAGRHVLAILGAISAQAQFVHDAGTYVDGLQRTNDVRGKDGEFVSADAGDRIHRAQGPDQLSGDLL